jgi:hypothetical protein
MSFEYMSEKAETYLQRLCLDIPHRRVGSEGNRAATGLFADTIAIFGFAVERSEFDCLDWRHGDARTRWVATCARRWWSRLQSASWKGSMLRARSF